MEPAPQGSGQSPTLPEFKTSLDNALKTSYSFCFRWSSVEPEVGLSDPCGSLPTLDIFWFYKSMFKKKYKPSITKRSSKTLMWCTVTCNDTRLDHSDTIDHEKNANNLIS